MINIKLLILFKTQKQFNLIQKIMENVQEGNLEFYLDRKYTKVIFLFCFTYCMLRIFVALHII